MARKAIPVATVKRLFSRSGNRCAFPSCNQILADDNGDLFANICHIEAAEKGGERYNIILTSLMMKEFHLRIC